jgi:hypothetical protein
MTFTCRCYKKNKRIIIDKSIFSANRLPVWIRRLDQKKSDECYNIGKEEKKNEKNHKLYYWMINNDARHSFYHKIYEMSAIWHKKICFYSRII